MKEITFSIDEELLEAVEERARKEGTTLEELFRRWLEEYVQQRKLLEQHDQVMADLRGKVRIGRKLTRDEMNER